MLNNPYPAKDVHSFVASSLRTIEQLDERIAALEADLARARAALGEALALCTEAIEETESNLKYAEYTNRLAALKATELPAAPAERDPRNVLTLDLSE